MKVLFPNPEYQTTLKVSEVFTSIQGEGPQMGTLATFIRLGTCNLDCEFCDTKYAHDNWLLVTIQSIIEYVKAQGLKNVVITGGEPFVQYRELALLAADLRLAIPDVHIAVETNGSIEESTSFFDLVVVCPKDDDDYVRWIGKPNVVFKILVTEDTIDNAFLIASQLGDVPIYLMPIGITPQDIIAGSYAIMTKMQETKLPVILTPRLHVLLGLK